MILSMEYHQKNELEIIYKKNIFDISNILSRKNLIFYNFKNVNNITLSNLTRRNYDCWN